MSRIEFRKHRNQLTNNNRLEHEGYVDGTLVVFHYRFWVVEAVCNAIVAGHIEATGDTVRRLSMWAEKNDAALYDRFVRTGADGLQ